jgi:hypothetical protein
VAPKPESRNSSCVHIHTYRRAHHAQRTHTSISWFKHGTGVTHVVDIHNIIAVGLDVDDVAICIDVAEVITVSVSKPGKQLKHLIEINIDTVRLSAVGGALTRAAEGWRTSMTLITPSGTPRAGPEISARQIRAMSTSCRTRVGLSASANGATLAKPSATTNLAIRLHIQSAHYSAPLHTSFLARSQAVQFLREPKPFGKWCALAAAPSPYSSFRVPPRPPRARFRIFCLFRLLSLLFTDSTAAGRPGRRRPHRPAPHSPLPLPAIPTTAVRGATA